MPDSSTVQEVAKAAQRRQLTVMFCDIVDSTPLSTRLDPEDMTDVYRVFRDCCASSIEAVGGFTAKYMGDGVMAYFGFPRAHEDDAERAVHAALSIIRATPELKTAGGKPLAARVGIATGLVIVGDVIGDSAVEERDVVGQTPNLAARLQSAAGPNEIFVSNTTRRLAMGLFEFDSVGRLPLKGFNLKSPAWRVSGAKIVADHFRGRQSITHTPMLGRQDELAVLLRIWRDCEHGGGRTVGIVGEAGIGKSRLVDEFHRRIAVMAPHIWLEGGGAQIFRHTPFQAIAQTINRRLTGGRALAPAERMQRLERSLKSVGVYDGEALALIADLVGAGAPEASSAPAAGSQRRRQDLIAALADWLLMSAERWPTILVIEDMQWVDPSTLEFLQYLIERASKVSLLILYTRRPDFPAPWPLGGTHSQIALGRLDRENARNLALSAAPRPLAPDLIDKVVARADGIPLFVEELALLMGQDEAIEGDSDIPSALSDLLMARLDQLGSAKELAQIAAVLGGNIPLAVFAHVSGVAMDELREALEALTTSNVMVCRGEGDERTYAFRHALVEAAAYGTLPRRLRRSLHKRIALAMVERFAEMAERQPEVLAQHWLLAGEQLEAASAWRRAARLAYERHALREALHACEQGVAILKSLSPSPEVERDELALQNLLADVARSVEGYASPRALAAMARARELAGREGGLSEQLQRAFGEWAALSSRGDYDASAEPAERFVELARAEGSPSVLGSAQMVLITSRYRIGDLVGAEDAYQSGRSFFDHPEFTRRPGVIAQTFGNAALVAWLIGEGEEAANRSGHSLALSRTTGNPYDLAFAHYMAATQALLASTPEEAESLALEAIRLSEANGYLAFASATRIMLGRARAALGRPAEGAAMMDESLHGAGQPPVRGSMTMYLTWLAEAHAMNHDLDLAQVAIEKALSINPRELFFRPETLRVRGDLLHGLGRIDLAVADYRAAVELARSMGAKVFVARALSSLAGLQQSGGSGRRQDTAE